MLGAHSFVLLSDEKKYVWNGDKLKVEMNSDKICLATMLRNKGEQFCTPSHVKSNFIRMDKEEK
jgi:hypothetical protein